VESRQFGTTNTLVSPIGLGGNVFGYFCDQKETQLIIDAAHDLGVNYIDTSDSYSEGRSEQLIGNSIKGK